MKKHIPAVLAFTGTLFILVFLAWAFTRHGTAGMYHVNGILGAVINSFGVLGIALALLGGLLLRVKARGRTGYRWLSSLAVVLALPAIIIPVVSGFLLSAVFSGGVLDSPPRLLMTGNTGAYGIPDMQLVYTTEKETAAALTVLGGDQGPPLMMEEEKPSTRHSFVLEDLLPGTSYSYSLNEGKPVAFRTPSAAGPLRFAAGSDAHFGSPNASSDLTSGMLEAISSPENGFDAFFFLGDLVEYGFVGSQWTEALEALAPVSSGVPGAFAAGNHDTLFAGLGKFKKYCLPEANEEDALWYRLDIGPAHFLVLDMEWSGETLTSDRLEWLTKELSGIPDDEWKIVLSHGFFYGSGVSSNGWDWYDNPETIGKLAPIFEKHGVDLVLSGHNHRTELLESRGVLYAVCGAFGGLPDPEPTYLSPASIWQASGKAAFLDIAIDGDNCELVFRDHMFRELFRHSFALTSAG